MASTVQKRMNENIIIVYDHPNFVMNAFLNSLGSFISLGVPTFDYSVTI